MAEKESASENGDRSSGDKASLVLGGFLLAIALVVVLYANNSETTRDGAFRTYLLGVYTFVGGIVLGMFYRGLIVVFFRESFETGNRYWSAKSYFLILVLGGAISLWMTWLLAAEVSSHGEGFWERFPGPSYQQPPRPPDENSERTNGAAMSGFAKLMLSQASLGLSVFAGMRLLNLKPQE